jgi:hydroxypyruvate isomerase
MTKFSASLGFLWTELPLLDAIGAAARAGFDAVECHWPYDTPPNLVGNVLDQHEIPMLGINTHRGDVTHGENGLCALPHRKQAARAAIDQALEYAVAINAANIHVMAGQTDAPSAHDTFLDNLDYAATCAAPHNITILIEPLNTYDAPGYFLTRTDQAVQIIQSLNHDNVKMMFDCYHVQRMQGDIIYQLGKYLPHIGHIQFAAPPHRTAPHLGELNYSVIFAHLQDLGWSAPLGAEYKPNGPTENSLSWMQSLKQGNTHNSE